MSEGEEVVVIVIQSFIVSVIVMTISFLVWSDRGEELPLSISNGPTLRFVLDSRSSVPILLSCVLLLGVLSRVWVFRSHGRRTFIKPSIGYFFTSQFVFEKKTKHYHFADQYLSYPDRSVGLGLWRAELRTAKILLAAEQQVLRRRSVGPPWFLDKVFMGSTSLAFLPLLFMSAFPRRRSIFCSWS